MDEPTTSRGALLALNNHQHMVLTTKHAGSSLLCKYIAMELSAGKVDKHMDKLHDLLPIYIDLSILEDVMLRPGTLLDQVITELNDHLVEWGRSSFLDRVSAGSAIVILDNLDHLEAAQQEIALNWVSEVIESGNKLVLSTREPSHPVLSGIPVYEIAGLSLGRIMLMASHWIHGPDRAAGFSMNVKKAAHLQQILSQPVHLSMAIEVYDETSIVPESELQLASDFLGLATKTVRRAAKPKMGIPDYLQRSCLALIGFRLQSRYASGVPAIASEAELASWMQDVLGEDSHGIAIQNLEGFLDKTSIFVRSRHGYGFAHKSLMTLTAAQHIECHVVSPSFVLSPKAGTGITKQVISDWAKNPAWKDVLDWVKTILQKDRSQEWLDEFLAAVDGKCPDFSHHSMEITP